MEIDRQRNLRWALTLLQNYKDVNQPVYLVCQALELMRNNLYYHELRILLMSLLGIYCQKIKGIVDLSLSSQKGLKCAMAFLTANTISDIITAFELCSNCNDDDMCFNSIVEMNNIKCFVENIINDAIKITKRHELDIECMLKTL